MALCGIECFMHPSSDEIRRRLLAYVDRKGYGVVNEIAEATGVHRTTITRFRKGGSASEETLAALAEYLNPRTSAVEGTVEESGVIESLASIVGSLSELLQQSHLTRAQKARIALHQLKLIDAEFFDDLRRMARDEKPIPHD